MIRLFQQPWSLAACLWLASTGFATPSVNVGMKAAFSAGPYLLELLETAAGENSSAYFPLLDRIASGHFSTATTDADLYAKFLDVLREDGHITSSEALATFNLALSLRVATPRIEAHYQYYSTAVEPVVLTTSDCMNWVLFEGKQYCTPPLDTVAKDDLFSSQVRHLPFDRSIGAGREAVLYADPTSTAFGSFHEPLSKAAKQGALRYRLRYRRNEQTAVEALSISGYGVELALKRTDYIVIDDRAAGLDPEQKKLGTEAILDDDAEVADLTPLSTSELSSLGLKTASLILQSEDPFETLIKLTQDLPRLSAYIAKHNISDVFVKEFEENQAQGAPPGINWLWMNGVQLIERQIEPFALIEMLRRERKLVDGIRELGFNGKQAISLLGHQEVTNAKGDDEPLRYDWTDELEDGKVLIWLNDLEKDERYAQYPKDLVSLLQRTYPGQLPPVAKNLFTVVAPIDFTDNNDLAFVSQLLNLLYRGIPIRFGLVPLTSTAESVTRAKAVYHLIGTYGLESVTPYVQELLESEQSAEESLFEHAIKDRELLVDSEQRRTFAEVLDTESYTEGVKLAKQWAARLGTNTETRVVFVNGFLIPRDKNWMQSMGMRLNEDLQVVQKGVFHGIIEEDTWVPGLFLENAASKRNTYITLEDEKDLRMLDLCRIYTEHADLLGQVPVLAGFADSTKENWAVVTIVADVTAKEGQELVISALEFKRNNPGIRVDLIHNPEMPDGSSAVNSALKANEGALSTIETHSELERLVGVESQGDEEEAYFEALGKFLSVANIAPGTQTVILNGRIIGPIATDSAFIADDFQQLLEFEQKSRILPVYAAVDDLGLSEKLLGPLTAAKLTSIIALSTVSDLPEGIFESTPTARTALYDTWQSQHSAFEIGDKETASIHIVGLLNPVSEQGQRWAPILKVLSELDGVYLKLFMNPKEEITELPVKRFFRYVLRSRPSFGEDGKVKGLEASFKKLPSEALLTIGMNVPPAWLVAPQDSAHDLDNIKLSSIKSDVIATYQLKHILIEGHSREGRGSPPKGAQLVLATEKDPLLTDTIIMSNLGFFQFKANPGFYNIQLKEGRSSMIYEIESIGAQGWDPVTGDNGTELALIDFQGVTLYPRLQRRSGMEKEDVLQEAEAQESGSIVSKGLKFAGGLFGGGSKSKSLSEKEHAEINIFSVASGHLYERMLNIMMVSVMRHTKHTVKFWFIEQFLSPSFKEFIPHLAKEYGFKYEMVSFKWPHWLRQQKEKQREIWGYKILFLDVLFPLSLDKVIFVDADQIVRTDMIDLVNLDLQGAPYGFTPMCDSRVEMEGFRFWKQGYWANYLRGLPYHISALYVVDLRRFRELAAGDRLRQQYHTLSADPGSLANLDQDLPNHMQFQIPIHSLPQEWLWCETWCSDESLGQARTIDLCNNPQTKEPKLDRARRQVPEWTVYDDEIAALDKKRRGESLETENKGAESPERKVEKAKATNSKSRKYEENVHTIDEL
ncbi:UDP-glucose:glycoprotein glucosyltransferase [Cladobotryum mycophilum]|uniref:UDP-glucose:glycoprotein glucosyltransferase n=1 Tax=Cladobotryum mycophilum TaxID=491253 RepID=A0ABR0SLW5_9HYPO